MRDGEPGGRMGWMFSERTNWGEGVNELTRAVEQRQAAGLPILDLTASNPTRCGFALDAARILPPLAGPAALVYEPIPFGRPAAREAVARYYRERGASLDTADLCLTTSTSEGYSFLFRLLCDPGDEVLISTPSYPLFDYLARLDDVRLVPYPLLYEHGWQVEPGAIEERIGPRTRAIAVVHPNNPTGHYVSAAERLALERICLRHGIALIVDEVFLDYAWAAEAIPGTFAAGAHALTFVLSGMSKIAALPQMKLSWIAICGEESLRGAARSRLEVIADTFLSVNAPVQEALPSWLGNYSGLQQQIGLRVEANLLELDGQAKGTALTRLAAEGGWYAVLRVPAVETDEALTLRLFAAEGVLVHPGSAFGFRDRGWLVVSLLPETAVFAAALAGVLRVLKEPC